MSDLPSGIQQGNPPVESHAICGGSVLSAFHTLPLVWQRRDRRYVILDGWHRIHAAQVVSITQFDVNILKEDKTQALIQAMRSNLSHGLPLKSQERVQACLS